MTAPVQFTENALVMQYTASAGCTIGEAVVFNSDTTVQDAGAATDLAIGVAAYTATAGNVVDVYMFGHAVIPVVVGTGDCTRGTKAVLVADGLTDAAAHDSDGVVNASVYGVFIQSGVAGDTVGLLLTGCDSRGTS
ncbi:MAG: hypothetical protein ACTSX8_01575 [Alphaproteobacteria bacterium]